MNVKKWLRGLCAAVLCVAYVGTAGAAELQKVPTAWMGAQETFPIWYAKQKGWDKEVGLDVELLYFSSGMDALSTLPAKTWVFGGMGAIPALMGALRHDTYVIANCNDEAMVNAVMVRPDSPIMQTKGYNKSYPNVYGTPESVKGKTVLCTTVSSAHFALSSWLKALGLTEKDVTIKNMDQASALAAFEYGIGDIVTLWAPLTYVGEKRGWKVASTPHDCYRGLPIVIVADREFADKNPEVTAKFLSIYMRAIDMMKNEPMDKLRRNTCVSTLTGPVPTTARISLRWILRTIRCSTWKNSSRCSTPPKAPARPRAGRAIWPSSLRPSAGSRRTS